LHHFEAKNVKRNEAKEAKFFNLFGSERSETHAKHILFRFVSLRSETFFKAKPAHPRPNKGVKIKLKPGAVPKKERQEAWGV